MIKTQLLFTSTFIAIIGSYLYIFGETKTIEILRGEYLAVTALFVITLIFTFFKLKLKNHQLRNFLPNNDTSIKSTIIFFLIFEVIDYYEYDGFKGMISQWFFYWLLGLTFLILMPTLNYFLNYKLIKKQISK